jgi:hypothetical protein
MVNIIRRINQKANEYANSFGKGKTEISIRKITSKNPDYSLRTLQPLTPFDDDATELALSELVEPMALPIVVPTCLRSLLFFG